MSALEMFGVLLLALLVERRGGDLLESVVTKLWRERRARVGNSMNWARQPTFMEILRGRFRTVGDEIKEKTPAFEAVPPRRKKITEDTSLAEMDDSEIKEVVAAVMKAWPDGFKVFDTSGGAKNWVTVHTEKPKKPRKPRKPKESVPVPGAEQTTLTEAIDHATTIQQAAAESEVQS